MLHRRAMKSLIFISLISFVLSSCYRYYPPYNNFKPYRRVYATTPRVLLLVPQQWLQLVALC
ncbi:hypothetical protein clem_02310 [Legionella clemsonensis]|uniref:Lipoprotein n=1 Tax=Legionella clemsonensis TaxID=1867846 RepID=A0A222NZQ4_9GAMM|nr:hypothetical protein clem_02310 [Legionella clemsonensis]